MLELPVVVRAIYKFFDYMINCHHEANIANTNRPCALITSVNNTLLLKYDRLGKFGKKNI